MDKQLTREEIGRMLEQLAYKRLSIENYQHYPSYEFKLSQLKQVNDDMEKLRAMRNSLPKKQADRR